LNSSLGQHTYRFPWLGAALYLEMTKFFLRTWNQKQSWMQCTCAIQLVEYICHKLPT
jgi:hypothetical protein